ncbi:type IV pilus secretin PilQ [Methylobacillus caricis]|uniref:type IV pilus secretin PilQ n=1 Tax=Methylobacillus caricis TaxID=1971611 RepID=UPI001CFFC603|nr:type IV pilus secretin PilQ [Methylobacillus caricis]MCB5188757.1 type IV pilus secretin PilQ [Methylobacillus caricis]
MNIIKLATRFSYVMVAFIAGISVAYADDQSEFANKIEKIDFVAMSGGRVAVQIQTTKPLANPPAGFTLNNPSRIALDFPAIGNGLGKNSLQAGQGVLKTVNLAQAKDRTRLVLNLAKMVAYNTTTQGRETTIILQANELNATASGAVSRFAEAKAGEQLHSLNNIDFVRGKNGEGRIMVDLSDASAGIDIRQQGKTVVVDFINTELPAKLQRRLNVINFNTPVLYVDAMKQGNNTRLIIEPQGLWEQSAYQADKRFIIDIRPVVEDPNKLVQGSKPGYAGEKLSLNFQNIDVRSVLQVIADFTGLNIVTSDTVTGNLTLRLKDVPWDQALDIIMSSKGLTQRKTGNVIWVAPSDEVAAKEKLLLEASQQIEELEPMRTEVFTLRYQKAEAFKNIISDSKQKILSKRGSAVVDARTNTVFVQDTSKHLEEIQHIINKIDIPIKQVMIESRLVIADEKFGRSLGARFGVQKQQASGDTRYGSSGTLGNTITQRTTDPTTGVITETIANRVGSSTLATTSIPGTVGVGVSADGAQDLNVNLPVANAFGNFAFSLFRLPAGFLLNLELSALETDQRGKIVSSPRVTTANQQKAIIEQGTQIPFQQATSSGATAVQFKNASLSLEVTPQITPDEKIIMDLEVKKDKVGQIFASVPSIDTQRVQTQVLVANGETAVLGGIYEQTERNDVDKVPFFGDLPFIGNVFKRRTKQNDKTELLIFITPKVMDENLSVR